MRKVICGIKSAAWFRVGVRVWDRVRVTCSLGQSTLFCNFISTKYQYLLLAGLSGLFSTVTVISMVTVMTMVRLSSVPFNNALAKTAYQPKYCASAQGTCGAIREVRSV